jgi:hypothetical protein
MFGLQKEELSRLTIEPSTDHHVQNPPLFAPFSECNVKARLNMSYQLQTHPYSSQNIRKHSYSIGFLAIALIGHPVRLKARPKGKHKTLRTCGVCMRIPISSHVAVLALEWLLRVSSPVTSIGASRYAYQQSHSWDGICSIIVYCKFRIHYKVHITKDSTIRWE